MTEEPPKDFTEALSDYAFSVDDLEAPTTEEYDPEPQREELRGILAVALVAILAAIVGLSFIAIWWDWATPEEVRELLSALFPPLVALAGTALGFYFGGHNRSR